VNHSAGAKVEVAHPVAVTANSLLGREILQGQAGTAVPVNSSHHQSADVIGDGLRAVAYSPEDNVVEAIEGTMPGHYVVAVQWHPERSFEQDQVSGSLFRCFVQAAQQWLDKSS
jgi:putative glutamine amidotransferase